MIRSRKRKILPAVLAGVVTSLVNTLTSSQLASMTQYENDGYDSIINNQNPIIPAIQDHETRFHGKKKRLNN